MDFQWSVLVVDSDLRIQKQVGDKLKTANYNVVIAGNFEQALQFIQNQIPPFHVVVTDTRLDEGSKREDGFRLIQEVRNRMYPTQALFFSRYLNWSHFQKYLSCLHFHHKPHAFLNPQFFAEEGTIFFKNSFA